jgi:SAM-dependent methyltransferase
VIFHRKLESHKRMLELCETGAGPRTLLDFGSNFGGFMELAKEAGWETVGVEPSEEAATTSRKKGLDVRCAWSLEAAALSDGCFGAIVANDVFYYVWEPFLTLRKCYALLAPGGCLAMRISNKRMWLTAARMVLPAGQRRTAIANRLLRGEFHTISSTKLGDVLRSVGFEHVQVFGRAATAPLKECGLLTKLAYIGADVVWTLSAHNLNLYPGVYVVAQKPVSPRGTGELLSQGGSTRPLVLPQ